MIITVALKNTMINMTAVKKNTMIITAAVKSSKHNDYYDRSQKHNDYYDRNPYVSYNYCGVGFYVRPRFVLFCLFFF